MNGIVTDDVPIGATSRRRRSVIRTNGHTNRVYGTVVAPATVLMDNIIAIDCGINIRDKANRSKANSVKSVILNEGVPRDPG